MAGSHKDWTKENERLQLIRQHHEKETGKFIREFVRSFKKYLRKKVPNPKETAIDLAHQVVTVFYCKEDLVLSCKLLTYSIRIAKNLLSNEQQKKFHHRTDSEPTDYFYQFAAEDDIYELIEESEIKLAVHRCLKRLSEKCQRILRSVMEDESPSEAAKKLGYSTTRVFSARKSECWKNFETEARRCDELKGLSF